MIHVFLICERVALRLSIPVACLKSELLSCSDLS